MSSRTPVPSSASWRERALAALPAGSNGEFGLPPELVPVIERGSGPRVWDTEGREFVDFTMAWGAALPGHGRPSIIEAAMEAAADGANFAAVNRRAVQLAERLQSLCPCAERVRFVASGTEATMLCLRVAHAATGRRKVLRFEGAYHGQHPVGVAGMIHGQPRNLPQCDPAGAGAPWVEQDVLVAPYNHLDQTAAIIAAHASDLAAVIVEPFHRCLSPAPGFLQGLREVTRKHGIVLVFDEVVTGFRFAPGGAQEYYGVTPDLAAYGKALGGGFPIGAYAGRADIMDMLAPEGPVYQAGTLSGNPLALAAGLAQLREMEKQNGYARLEELGKIMEDAVLSTLKEVGRNYQWYRKGSMFCLFFTEKPVKNLTDAKTSDMPAFRKFFHHCLSNGVYFAPSQFETGFISLAHSPDDIARTAEVVCDALKSLD